MTATAPPPCPCRDSCPCVGPVPLCLHGYHGPLRGTPGTVAAADGSALAVYRVTAADCAGCPVPGAPKGGPGVSRLPGTSG